MTPADFGFWLRGMAGEKMDTVSFGAMVLTKALTIQGATASAAAPQMRAHPLNRFCVHNVNLNEPCAPCALGPVGTRLYGVRLPATARMVYTSATAVQESPDG